MGDNLRLKQRYAIRTPMQWSAERNAGFSTASELVRPLPMIRPWKQCPEIGSGEWRILRAALARSSQPSTDGAGARSSASTI
jgi:glycosidase